MTLLWWLWTAVGLLFSLAALGIFGRGLWQLRYALLADVAWPAKPYQSRGFRLIAAGRTLILAGLTAGTAWLCLVATRGA
jgi:hypothetical protein